MNLIISKTKHEQLNACWEPFATSTPVKSASNRVKILSRSQNQLLKDTEYLNFVGLNQASSNISNTLQRKTSESKITSFKRLKKNKTAAYFDLNSSSDEDSSGEKKRPIIKCSSGNATNSFLLSSKNVNNHEVKVESGMQTTEKNKIAKLKTEISFNTKNLETQKCQTFSWNSKVRDTIEKSGSKLPNLQTGSDNICTVNDESSLGEKIMKVQVPNENKENTANYSKNTEIDKQSLKSKKQTKGQIKRNLKIVKSVQKNCKNDAVSENIGLVPKKNILPEPVGEKTESNNSAKLLKRTREEKIDTKEGPPLCLFNAKSNDSHQLFSDSKEQEAINSLDLTSDSINELMETSQSPVLVRENNFSLKPNNSFIEKTSKANKIGNKKSKKNSSGMLESLDQESLKKKMNKDSSTKTNNTHFKFDLKTEKKRTSKNNQKRNLRITTLKKNLVQKNNKKSDVCQNEAPKRNNKEGNLINVSDSSGSCIRESENKNAHETDTPVCIHLNDLAFQNNHAGCFVEQCWNIKNFKCGVFKVEIGSQLNWKTHHLSTMGCVLIKGEVKMKIGSEEFNINEGDMTLIPPSTEWHAINVGNSESVLYYWCGKFNS